MGKPKTPREVLHMLFRRKTLFLLGAAFFSIIVLWGAHWMPLKYTASLTFERTNDVGSTSRIKGAGTFDEIRPILKTRLGGPTVLKEALQRDEIGLARTFPRNADGTLTSEGHAKMDTLVREIQPALRILFITSSDLMDVVSIEFEHADRDVAERLPRTLFEMFQTSTINELNERLSHSKDGLEKELDAEKAKLEQARMKKNRFELEYQDSMPHLPTGLQDRLNTLNKDLDRVERNLALERSRLDKWKEIAGGERLAGDPTSQPADADPEPDEYLMGINPKLGQLQDKLKDIEENLRLAKLAGMTEKHPTYQQIVRLIEELKKQIEAEPEKIRIQERFIKASAPSGITLPQMQVADAEMRIKNFTDEQTELVQAINRTKELMNNFLKIRQDYLALCHNEQTCQETVDRLQKSYQTVEADLKAELAKRRTMIKVVQEPQRQYLPSSPKLSLILLVAIVGGLAFGGLLVFLANGMDRTVGTTDEAMKYFNIPLHGAVGEISTPKDRTWRRVKLWVITPIIAIVVVTVIGASCLDTVLWLKQPTKHKEEWRKAPITYVVDQVKGVFSSSKI
ncbi:MAG: hypothetical protein FWE88_00165 [Phycisphaerae bacterium]|nr:hypothetical protein [Phycisphaerae bacterium]